MLTRRREQNGDRVYREALGAGRELRLVLGAAGLSAQEARWNDLVEAGRRASPFDVYPMAVACAEAAQACGSTIITAIFDDGGNAATILPLRTEQHLGIRRAVPLTAPISQYAPGIGAPITTEQLQGLGAALSRHCGIDILLLRRVRPGSALHDALVATGTGGEPESAQFIDLAAWQSFDAYDKAFSNSTRRNRRQRRQKLEAEIGPVTFEVVDAACAGDVLRSATGWKADWLREAGLPSPVLGDEVWCEALIACAQAPGAHLSVMQAGGRCVAVELGFSQGSEYVAYLGAFDPAMARYSVGQEQMVRTIAWCFEQGFTRYDLLAPDDSYKRFWTRGNPGETVTDFTLPVSLKGQAYAFAYQHGRPLAKRAMHAVPAPIRRAVMRA
jgi:CelD/BcsL family acetyltransferase involved in cellulose biosynthesis